MDDGTAAVLAALISGAVVAGTFLAAEIIRLVRDRRAQRAAAIGRVLERLDQIPLEMVGRRWWKRPQPPDLHIASAAMAVFPHLPRRDRRLIDWLGWKVSLLAEVFEDDEQRIKVSASITGALYAYLAEPKSWRRIFVRDEQEMKTYWDSVQ